MNSNTEGVMSNSNKVFYDQLATAIRMNKAVAGVVAQHIAFTKNDNYDNFSMQISVVVQAKKL